MPVENESQIKARITAIREETAPEGNTKKRVADTFENIYDTLASKVNTTPTPPPGVDWLQAPVVEISGNMLDVSQGKLRNQGAQVTVPGISLTEPAVPAGQLQPYTLYADYSVIPAEFKAISNPAVGEDNSYAYPPVPAGGLWVGYFIMRELGFTAEPANPVTSVSINGGDPQVPGPLGHLDIPLENATYDAPGLMVAADKIRMDQQLGPANSQSVRLKVRPTINQREDAGHYYYDIATDGVVTVNNVDYPVNGLTGATFSKTVNYDTVALFYIYLDDDTYKVTFTGSSLANIRYLFGVAGRSYFAFYFIPKNGGVPRPYYWEAPVQKRPTKTITGSYVLTADDHGYNILYDSTSPGTITCPNGNAGSDIVIFQVSTGAFEIVAASGATVENFDSKFKSAGQKAIVSLTCYQRGNAVVWHPNGNLIA